MDVIINLLQLYIKNTLFSIKKLSLVAFLIVAGCYNAFLIINFDNISNVDIDIRVFAFLLFFFTILRKFFPNLTNYVVIIKDYYPINSLRRYLINLLNDSIFSYYFLAIIFFLSSFFYLKEKFHINNLIIVILSLISAYILRRIISTLIFKRLNKNFVLKVIVIALNCIIIMYFCIHIASISLIPILVLVNIFLFSFGYYIEEFATTYNHKKINSRKFFENVHLQLIIPNKKIRFSFFAAFILKLLILTIISIGYIQKGEYKSIFITFLFTSPVLLFNYLINNFFGFFDKYWLSLQKSGLSGKDIFKSYLKVLVFFLSIDFILTLIFCLVNYNLFVDVMIVYLGTTILLIPLGFYWSVLFPKKIQGSMFNTKSTTAIIPVILTFAICCTLFLVLINIWFSLIIVVYALISVSCIINLNNFYAKKNKSIYSKLN